MNQIKIHSTRNTRRSKKDGPIIHLSISTQTKIYNFKSDNLNLYLNNLILTTLGLFLLVNCFLDSLGSSSLTIRVSQNILDLQLIDKDYFCLMTSQKQIPKQDQFQVKSVNQQVFQIRLVCRYQKIIQANSIRNFQEAENFST